MTKEQRDVLAHIVADPDAWYAHAVAHRGEEFAAAALAAKVEKWRTEFESAKAKDGDYYKDRLARDAADAAAADLKARR